VMQEGRMFFFEKKNQKTFAPWPTLPERHGPHKIKVFCFFFSKKKPSFFVCLAAFT